jgi:Tol biopolymer transport system component
MRAEGWETTAMDTRTNRSSAARGGAALTVVAMTLWACAAAPASTPSASIPTTTGSPALASPSGASPDPTASAPVAAIEGQLLLGSLTGDLERYFVLDEGKLTQIFEAEGCNPCVSPSIDGRLVVYPYVAPGDTLATAVYTVGTGHTAQLPVPVGFSGIGPGPLSPDKTRILHHAWSDRDPSANGIYTTAIDGSGLALLSRVTDGRGRDPMDWSPDGKSVLIFSEDQSRTAERHLGDLSVLPAAGGKPVQLNQPNTSVAAIIRFGTAATFSHDGSRVAFAVVDTDDPNRSALFVADTADGHATPITDWVQGTTTALWSPVDDWILFDRRPADGFTFSIIRPDGSDERPLWGPDSPGWACCATWSPDGSKILFQRGGDGPRELWVMDRDGTIEGRVDVEPATWIWYRWTPSP